MKNRSLWTVAFLAFLAAWGAPGALVFGTATVVTTMACHPDTCPGSNPQTASSSVRDYTLDSIGLQAFGVVWPPPYVRGDTVVTLRGSGDACMVNGGIDGPITNTAVYECASSGCPAGTSIHCPGGDENTCGVCPSPCIEYHTHKAIRNRRTGPTLYRNVCFRKEGDGPASYAEGLGREIECQGCYFESIHDDVMEQDWGCRQVMRDSLVTNAFNVFAMNPREGDNVDLTGCSIESYGNIIRLFRFPNAYKNKPGHGGLTKTPPGIWPRMVLQNTKLFAGPVVGSGQEVVPPRGRFHTSTDCASNILYFSGDNQQWQDFLADDDGLDPYTNGERLVQLAYCIQVVRRDPATESELDFLFTHFFPTTTTWKDNHAADNACTQ